MAGEKDEFADVRNSRDVRSFGMLEGEAVGDLERVTEKATPQGVLFRLRCQQCGAPNDVFVSWQEMIMGAAEQIPFSRQLSRQWTHGYGMFLAPQGCTNCKRVLMGVTPDECWRHLGSAEKKGFLQRGYAQAAVAQLQQRAGQYQR